MRPAEPTIAPIRAHSLAFMSPIIVIWAWCLPDVCSAGVMTFGCKAMGEARREVLACWLPARRESGRGRIDIHDLWISRPSAPRCSVRGAARFVRHTTVHSNHERRSKSACTPLLDTGKLAMNLRRMGWPIIRENARRLKARLPLPNQPLAKFSLSELLSAAACRFPRGSVGL